MPEVHAKLSASGAKRWLACTQSPSMEEGLSDTTSVYAEEGTAAHSLAELKLQHETGKITKRTFTVRYNKFKKENPYYSPGMDDFVDEYVALVLEQLNSYESADIDLEVRVDFSRWVPKGFGTSDVVITSDGVIEVIDLKYGKGVPVKADHNPQIMLYGLGAYAAYDMIYDFKIVRMTIVQPRLGDISTYEMTVEDLLKWANDWVKPRADLAMRGAGEFAPSEETCKWCKAKAFCKARAEKNLEIAKYDFEDPVQLSEQDIADILGQAKEIEGWLKDVKEYSLTQARDHGKKFPGWKLVEGRSNRKITDEKALLFILEAEGFKDEDLLKPRSLQTLTKLEKTVGKKQLTELAADLIIKPEGAPVLVSEDDKRPELSGLASANNDFNN
ncbi:DUF2800 domain-containing protein [Enterococcus sp. CSURQ0835]|uniref:DUF2800 domain-containing protein n=1 Tax=Enterococcus sp. CSURQ0835 TaxID=2681394 RepID=UPI00135BA02D|nr:DUF2800 domain-containing protein [Enterococcus sp. CSURQ0835]